MRYHLDGIRTYIRSLGAVPNMPHRSNRKNQVPVDKALYRDRNRVERFFNT